MKRLNFNIKDRKVLYGILGIVLVSVFSLTIAYAALNAVLTISGSAQVSSADWDVHLDNVRLNFASATSDIPKISGNNTINFNTVLNMPGDFYEFHFDVVNSGSIDAMIENITKIPTLSAEQAKYLKYEVSYQNGESITTKQLLAKETSMPIKVRIEYRNDISASDLPTGQVVLDLSIKLNYIQSDSTGTSVNNNGTATYVVNAVSGDGTKFGDEVCIQNECFYVISSDEDTVTMFSKMNVVLSDKPFQSTTALGVIFSNVGPYYENSVVESYCNLYKNVLVDMGVEIIDTRPITHEELIDDNTFDCPSYDGPCSDRFPWIYSTRYWTASTANGNNIWVMDGGRYDYFNYKTIDTFGVRPVVILPKKYFFTYEKDLITFTIDGVTYEAENNMSWYDWIYSEYNTKGFNTDSGGEVIFNCNAVLDPNSNKYVLPTELIVEGTQYILEEYPC